MWLQKLAPIVLLLIAIGVVVSRLPKVELGHSPEFKRRRLANWLPLGMTYAFLYFGRYNLAAIVGLLQVDGILTKEQFNSLDGVGQAVYGIAFLLNGPLTDRFGGRFTLLLASGGAMLANIGMGALVWARMTTGLDEPTFLTGLTIMNAVNMYFQSFGAVSIVKVNAPWFHVRERGVLGGLFGILISLGLYFSYDWTLMIAKGFPGVTGYVGSFVVPAAVLAIFFVLDYFLVRDSPSTAGFADFDTGDATSGQKERLPLVQVVRFMFSQKIIWIIVAVEFCSGFLRQAVMKQYRPYATAVGEASSFVYENWGMLLCVAGILGGVFAGFISDYVFQSRRGPVSSVLYAGLLAGAVISFFTVGSPALSWAMVFMSLCVIGVHGMLSGTASMDFGGSKNAGVVTGIIDGFVYLGGATQGFLFSQILPRGEEAKAAANWSSWPTAMIPFAVIGLVLCATLWNARPKAGAASGH